MGKNWDKLLKFTSLRPRSGKEITGWLFKKKVGSQKQQEYLTRLKELDLIDDERFAFWWVEERRIFRPRSKRHLAWELQQKGIAKEIIKEALENVDEVQAAQKLIVKRVFASRQKLQEYLARKGFDWEAIKKVKLRQE